MKKCSQVCHEEVKQDVLTFPLTLSCHVIHGPHMARKLPHHVQHTHTNIRVLAVKLSHLPRSIQDTLYNDESASLWQMVSQAKTVNYFKADYREDMEYNMPGVEAANLSLLQNLCHKKRLYHMSEILQTVVLHQGQHYVL